MRKGCSKPPTLKKEPKICPGQWNCRPSQDAWSSSQGGWGADLGQGRETSWGPGVAELLSKTAGSEERFKKTSVESRTLSTSQHLCAHSADAGPASLYGPAPDAATSGQQLTSFALC